MKKNVDQMTADLYNATKAAYLREFSGIIRNNAKGQPVTINMMIQIVDGCNVDGLALADGTDLKKVIDLMPGYSCSLASLPRIYKQAARLAGETCEKITVGVVALNAYGLTDEQLNAKENKKILAVIKKYCPAPKKNDSRAPYPYRMGLYHDSRRRCAVWTDARILIVAPWLYNDAAAGHIVAADGTKITDFEGQPPKYPDWSKAVPDMSYKTAKAKKFEVYSVNAAAVAENAANVAATIKGVKKAKECFIAARYASDGGIVAFAHALAPWFALVNGDLYFKNAHTAAVGYIHTAAGNGFILFMPMMVKDDEIDQYADNKTLYADPDNDIYFKNRMPQAAADSLPLPFLAVCPEVDTPAEPVTDVVETPTADVTAETAADVVETPAEPVTAETAADVVETPAEPVTAETAADVVETPAEPVTAEPVTDVVETPAEPVTDAAAAVIETPTDTADTYTADEVAAMIAAAVAEERARHTRRRFVPRLWPVLRRLGRVAAMVLPLLIVALAIGAGTASTANAPTADAATVTTCQAAAETVARVVELPAVTVTASRLTTAPAAPSPVKKLAAPSPVKKAAADVVTLSGQKTASDIATAAAPAADDADSLTTAPAAAANGLTICAGTPWAYTMMNWA